jgi:hypothetical protein
VGGVKVFDTLLLDLLPPRSFIERLRIVPAGKYKQAPQDAEKKTDPCYFHAQPMVSMTCEE